MQLAGLQRFVEIAEAGSYYQAEKNGGGISAQAYSKTVSSLEKELGVRIVKVSRKGVELTPEGSVFLEFARRTLDNYADLQERLRSAHHPSRSNSPIVFATFYAAAVISELISQGLIQGNLRVCEDAFDAIVNRASSFRDNEIALVDLQDGHGPNDLRGKGLSFKSLADCRPMVALSENSDLARLGRTLEISDLWGSNIVCNSHPEMQRKYRKIFNQLPRGTEINRLSSVRGLWEYLRINPDCVFVADSIQCALMPGAGGSVGKGFVFVPIATNYLPAKLGVLRAKGDKKSPEAAKLIYSLSEIFKDLAG